MADLIPRHAELFVQLQEALRTETNPEVVQEYMRLLERLRSYGAMEQERYDKVVEDESRMLDKMSSGL